MLARLATKDDVPEIARVQVSSWHAVYAGLIPDEVIAGLTVERRVAQWNAFFDRGHAHEAMLVAEHDGGVVGMSSVGPSREEEPTGEIRAIYVQPDHWDHGHGRDLIVASERWLSGHGFGEAILWVLEANERAREFYESAGWSRDGAKKIEDILGALLPEVRYRIALEAS